MRKKSLDDRKKELEIHLILDHKSNMFWVGKTKSPNSYQIFKNHARLEYSRTKELFSWCKETGNWPKMYLLERERMTDESGFQHCVAWTKYFSDLGFRPLAGEKTLRYADDMLPETQALYDGIKGLLLEEVLGRFDPIVRDYRPVDRTKARTPKTEIKFSVKEKEYQFIQESAMAAGLTMSKFCREQVLRGRIVQLELPPIERHTAALDDIKERLRQVLVDRTIGLKEREWVQCEVDRVTEVETELTKTFLDYMGETMKHLH